MLNILKTATKIATCFSILVTVIAAAAGELTLPVDQNSHIYIHAGSQRAIAANRDGTIRYDVARPLSVHVLKAEALRLVSHEGDSGTKQFIILSHELSRPGALGRGYCGGGYEDYLLLIEISGRRIILLDELLLQSCLTSIDLGDDDPLRVLIPGKNGSFSFRWLSDDYQRNLSVIEKRFHMDLIPITDN